jgi:hypothetical protein
MTTTFRARFEDGKLVPQEPVELPSDQDLEVEVRASKSIQLPADSRAGKPVPALLELLERLDKLPSNPNSPTDAAAQHDHYLYGRPKRENP